VFCVTNATENDSPVVTGAGEDPMETSPVIMSPPSKSMMYYIDDGVYGSFNCVLFDHAFPVPKVLGLSGRVFAEDEEVSSIRIIIRHSSER
jgi:hypothetical protein